MHIFDHLFLFDLEIPQKWLMLKDRDKVLDSHQVDMLPQYPRLDSDFCKP